MPLNGYTIELYKGDTKALWWEITWDVNAYATFPENSPDSSRPVGQQQKHPLGIGGLRDEPLLWVLYVIVKVKLCTYVI